MMKMNIISAANPRWADAGQTTIDLDVDFENIGLVPFSASASDTEAHGGVIFNQAVAGIYGPITPYAAPVKTPDQLAKEALDTERKAARSAIKVNNFKALTRPQVKAMAADPTKQSDLLEVLALAAWANLND
jgi:hypothetical protein